MPARMRRADRLFQIVQMLRRRRLTTAAQLAERLEVSERTVYRDIRDTVTESRGEEENRTITAQLGRSRLHFDERKTAQAVDPAVRLSGLGSFGTCSDSFTAQSLHSRP